MTYTRKQVVTCLSVLVCLGASNDCESLLTRQSFSSSRPQSQRNEARSQPDLSLTLVAMPHHVPTIARYPSPIP